MERLLTVAEAAERAGVSDSLVYEWCQTRRLAHFRPGGKGKRGKILISPDDLDVFISSLRVEAEATPARPGPRKVFRHLIP
jgi:excisionase family DNA binding protein